MKKIINIGKIEHGQIFCKIEIKKDVLSISGVIGPMLSGNCKGACGQINSEIIENTGLIKFAKGWNNLKLKGFLNIWDRWHLNDLRAGCQHQRIEEWNKEMISEPCNVCNYKYGTKWLKEELPEYVIEYLEALPESAKTPAWV